MDFNLTRIYSGFSSGIFSIRGLSTNLWAAFLYPDKNLPEGSGGPPSPLPSVSFRYSFVTFFLRPQESFPVNSCPNGSKVGIRVHSNTKRLDKSGGYGVYWSQFPVGNKSYKLLSPSFPPAFMVSVLPLWGKQPPNTPPPGTSTAFSRPSSGRL